MARRAERKQGAKVRAQGMAVTGDHALADVDDLAGVADVDDVFAAVGFEAAPVAVKGVPSSPATPNSQAV